MRVSPIAYRGCAYGVECGAEGTWVCADLATGAVKWKGPKGVSADMTSPVIADGKLIVFGPPGHSHTDKGCGVYIFKASPEKFEEVGHWDPHAASCQSPAIADGKLYFRTENEQSDFAVVCYDLRK
jgi:outer membrane protein assembly factor BamB